MIRFIRFYMKGGWIPTFEYLKLAYLKILNKIKIKIYAIADYIYRFLVFIRILFNSSCLAFKVILKI